MLRGGRAGLLAVLVILGTVPQSQAALGQFAVPDAQLPSLPEINLTNYPAVSRAPIGRALAAVRAHPRDARSVGELGMMLHAWEQFDAASAVYARAAALAPQFEWFYLRGLVESRLAHYRQSASLLNKALQRSPTSVPARLALADALFESGDIGAARDIYGVLRRGAAEPHARYGLGRALAATGEQEAAVREFEAALRLFPEFGAAWYARGLSLRRLGRLDEAKESLAKAQQYGTRWPAVEDPVVARVRGLREDAAAHSDRALVYQRRGEIAAAIGEYEAAVAADPKWVKARVNLIALYGGQRQWEKAESHFHAVVDFGLRVAEAHYNFGVCLASQGDTARAAEQFKTALDINPQYAQAWVALAQIAEREGRVAEAEASYRNAAEQAPGDGAIQFNLARMMLARHHGRDAIAVLERIAGRDDPDRARFLFALATAYVQAGDVATARRYAVEARDLARSRGQGDLAAAIERDLAGLP
jgi:tetratricopeptide (TPR) repeat protein